MTDSSDTYEALNTQRKLRVVSILTAAGKAGLEPLGLKRMHTIAYMADALAPVWDMQILDAQLLKQAGGPMSPTLQRDIDRLVGMGVVIATNVHHTLETSGWRLSAEYCLNQGLAIPILNAALGFDEHAAMYQFVEEVVFAVSAMSLEAIERATESDAAYADPLVDVGGLLDLVAKDETNKTARIARHFGDLVTPGIRITDAEMTHLYVRHLFRRLQNVA